MKNIPHDNHQAHSKTTPGETKRSQMKFQFIFLVGWGFSLVLLNSAWAVLWFWDQLSWSGYTCTVKLSKIPKYNSHIRTSSQKPNREWSLTCAEKVFPPNRKGSDGFPVMCFLHTGCLSPRHTGSRTRWSRWPFSYFKQQKTYLGQLIYFSLYLLVNIFGALCTYYFVLLIACQNFSWILFSTHSIRMVGGGF